MPPNQQQIIEQAKFTYSPLGKAFEKQPKTIEDQGEKQIKIIRNKYFNKSIEKVKFDSDGDLAILRQKEIYNELTEEKKTEMKNLDNSADRDKDKLIYKYKGNTSDVNFVEYFGAIDLINKIKDEDISLKQAIENQYDLKSKLGEVKKGNPNRKSKKNLEVIKNVDNLYDSRQAAINIFIEYTERVSEARFRLKQEGGGLKILTPKQMLQRSPIPLAQIKAGNNSQSILNEIRQIVYSLYQSKEITENNITKSIKV